MKEFQRLAPLAAGLVAVTALIVMGGIVVVALVTGRDVPWSEITLAVTTLLAAAGGWAARQPARLRDDVPPTLPSSDLARAVRQRREAERAALPLRRRPPSDGGGAVVVVVAAATLAAVLAAGCTIQPNTPNVAGRYAGLACSAVDAVCGAAVLPEPAQEWCGVVRLACRATGAVVVAVLDAVADAPPAPKCATAAPCPPAVSAEVVAAVCADGPPEGHAEVCAAVEAGELDGVVVEPGR